MLIEDVLVNGNYLAADATFVEKRRRGLTRFVNALVRHPVLSQEQLVIMFLTVPTVCIISFSISAHDEPTSLRQQAGTSSLAQTSPNLRPRRIHQQTTPPRPRRLSPQNPPGTLRHRPLWGSPLSRSLYQPLQHDGTAHKTQ